MPKRTPLSYADLLVCLQGCVEDQWDAVAVALGYVRHKPKQESEPESHNQPGSSGELPRQEPPQRPAPAAPPKARFYRVVAQRELEPAEVVRENPEWFQQAELYREVIRAAADASPPAPEPLMRWSRLWPFLKAALGAQWAMSALDVPRIVDLLAQGQTLRYLPRQQRYGWAARCQIIVDKAEPLLPFQDDFKDLRRRLPQLRGKQGLEVIAFPDGDPGGRCWLYSNRRWRTIDGYPEPAPGAPVLVLSDLGCIDGSDVRRRQWLHFGARLQRLDCRPVALMPCPPRWWDRELARLFYPVCWDRATRPPQRIGAQGLRRPSVERADRDDGAERLLALLAPAIRVEPALLRAVRYLLPARAVDVGSEAAAWNHPSVHATHLAFYYDEAVIEKYRAKFPEQDAALRQQVTALIAACHAHLSPVIGYEEQRSIADLENAPPPADTQRFFQWIVKTLCYGDEIVAGPFQSWIQRWGLRQHAAMWRDGVLAAAWVASQLRTGGPLEFPEGLDLASVAWLLGQGQAPKRYILRQQGEALYLEADTTPAAAASGLEAPGSPVADVSATAPHVQLQRIAADGQPRDEPIQRVDQAISLDADERLHLRTDHQELTIDSIPRPPWAEAIGRDEQGLFVVWQSGQRRARWVNPGSYPVRNRSGDPLGQLTMESGYWRDEVGALAQQREGFPQPDWAEGYGLDDYGLYADVRIQGVVQRLRWIAPGEFMMGSPENEAERLEDRETLHSVILTPGYWLADTACTQALWQAVMGGDNPSRFKGEDRPVENVTWDDVQRFIEKLNSLVPDGDFRLPTEAEWEYACRAGTTTPFWFGDQITPEQVNYGYKRGETVAVKALPCNSWGLYQMHGNVWEWCQDWYGDYPVDTIVDPTGPAEGQWRGLRGGCWVVVGRHVRSAHRSLVDPADRFAHCGFRLARGQAVRSTSAGGEERERRQPRRTDAAEQVGQARRDAPASQDRKARKKKS